MSRRFWDGYAAGYDLIWDSPFTALLAAEIGARSRGDVVVDLGCGTGLATASLDCHVIGVDSSPAMLRRAEQRCDEVVLAAAERTPLPGQVADTVVLANVLHACDSPAAVIREALRLVRPGGQVVVTCPSDRATIDSITHTQLALGWSRPRAARAKALATLFGLLSAFAGVPRRSAQDVTSQLAAFVPGPISPESPPGLRGVQLLFCLSADVQEGIINAR